MLELCCRTSVRGSSESLRRAHQGVGDGLPSCEPEPRLNFCDLPLLTEPFLATVNRCLLDHVFRCGLDDTLPVLLSRSAASNLCVFFVVSKRVQCKG